MPFSFIRTLRARLFIVALAALIPLMGYFWYSHRQLVELAERDWQDTVVQVAEQVALEYRAAMDQSESLLSVLVQVPQIRAGGDGCLDLVARLIEDLPLLSALGRVDPDGFSRCLTPDPGEPVDLRDRAYIRQALATGMPQFSGFQLGRLTGNPVMSLAHPILDDDGTVMGAVASGVELDLLGTPQIPGARAGSVTVTVYDLEGRILARSPSLTEALGSRVPWGSPPPAGDPSRTPITEATDLDGQHRIFATRPLLTDQGVHQGYVAVGFDPEVTQAAFDRVFRDHVVGLVLAGTVLLAGIWLLMDFAFLRRLRPVLATARRLGQGDLNARTGLPDGEDEISIVARTVDHMAENLQRLQERDETRAREAIDERESRLQQLAESVDEVFWLFDPRENTLLYVNSAYEEIYGRSMESLRKDPASWIEAVHPEDREEVRKTLQGTDWAPPELEFRVIRPDQGVAWVRYRSFPARNEAGEIYRVAAVARDVTERRRLEEILHQSGRLEAVGRLAGGIAHDFNNVLTVIRGHTQLLLHELPSSDPVRQELEEIERSAERAASLTRQLLAFSRKQSLHPRIVAVNEVIRSLRTMLARLVGEQVKLVLDLDPEAGSARVDPNQLEQVLLNLAANARDAMEGGGTLTIRTRPTVHSPEAAGGSRELQAPGEYVRIVVSDTGKGMDEDVRTHAFEPFFTTKRVGEGTGLGLASVYGIVKQSGGFIWVFSEPGQGATFEIDLPRLDAAPDASATRDPGKPLEDETAGGTVLVAEDEESVLNVVCRALERHGYRVWPARSGVEALELFHENPQAIDLVLTDVVMPNLDGPELASRLREIEPDIPILFMSGYPAMVKKGAEVAGSQEQFIQKPFSPDELIRKVRQVMAHRAAAE